MTTKEAILRFGELLEADRLEDAAVVLRMLMDKAPNDGSMMYLHGVMLARGGRRLDAIPYYERACALSPQVPEFHEMLGMTLLAAGLLERGWELYEWRNKSARSRLGRDFIQPQWTGQDVAGRTVLLHAEGRGHGDAIQFCRYVPMVAARGAKVILECQPGLLGLLGRLPGVKESYTRGQALPPSDFQCPLNSLPLAFHTMLATIPANVPYLAPLPQRALDWRRRLGPKPAGITQRVGLAWVGTNTGKDMRSRTLATFAPLAGIAGVEFHSLQLGAEAREASPPGLRVIDHSAEIRDFDDTAALITNLDLVISVDSSVAHLAGALARDVWVLIPKVSDFRWLLDRSDSPWYPTMRLFRQAARASDWSDVATAIADALRQRITQQVP